MSDNCAHNWVQVLSWLGFMHKSWECVGCGLRLTEGEKAVLDELLAIKKLLIEQPAAVNKSDYAKVVDCWKYRKAIMTGKMGCDQESCRTAVAPETECSICGRQVLQGTAPPGEECLICGRRVLRETAPPSTGKAAKGEQVHFTSCVCGYSMPYAKGKCCKCGREP